MKYLKIRPVYNEIEYKTSCRKLNSILRNAEKNTILIFWQRTSIIPRWIGKLGKIVSIKTEWNKSRLNSSLLMDQLPVINVWSVRHSMVSLWVWDQILQRKYHHKSCHHWNTWENSWSILYSWAYSPLMRFIKSSIPRKMERQQKMSYLHRF